MECVGLPIIFISYYFFSCNWKLSQWVEFGERPACSPMFCFCLWLFSILFVPVCGINGMIGPCWRESRQSNNRTALYGTVIFCIINSSKRSASRTDDWWQWQVQWTLNWDEIWVRSLDRPLLWVWGQQSEWWVAVTTLCLPGDTLLLCLLREELLWVVKRGQCCNKLTVGPAVYCVVRGVGPLTSILWWRSYQPSCVNCPAPADCCSDHKHSVHWS